MSEKFKVEIITPEKSILKSDADEVNIPSFEGEMGILKNHIPSVGLMTIEQSIKRINGQFKIKLWWDNDLKSNSDAKLNFDVLDTFLKDRPISVPYELKIFYNGLAQESRRQHLCNNIVLAFNPTLPGLFSAVANLGEGVDSTPPPSRKREQCMLDQLKS